MTYDHWKQTEGNPWVNDETPTGDEGPPEYWQGKTGKWFIHYDPPPIPVRTMDWHFYHDDFDGAPDSRDGRSGHGSSWADCVTQIQEMEEEGE